MRFIAPSLIGAGLGAGIVLALSVPARWFLLGWFGLSLPLGLLMGRYLHRRQLDP